MHTIQRIHTICTIHTTHSLHTIHTTHTTHTTRQKGGKPPFAFRLLAPFAFRLPRAGHLRVTIPHNAHDNTVAAAGGRSMCAASPALIDLFCALTGRRSTWAASSAQPNASSAPWPPWSSLATRYQASSRTKPQRHLHPPPKRSSCRVCTPRATTRLPACLEQVPCACSVFRHYAGTLLVAALRRHYAGAPKPQCRAGGQHESRAGGRA